MPASPRPGARRPRRTHPVDRCGSSPRDRRRAPARPVDPSEAQSLVADVELVEAGQAGADDDVSLLAELMRPPAPGRARSAGAAPVGRAAPRLVVRPVDMRLFGLELRWCGHGRPSPPPLRGEPSMYRWHGWLPATGPTGTGSVRIGATVPTTARPCWSLPGPTGEPTRPVWFMRQAGRSLPEYRAARGSGSILDAIGRPELAAELTLQPVRRYGVDAAIFFSDIVVPAAAVGFGVDVEPGRGPVVAEPFRTEADLARLRPLEPGDLAAVEETVRILVAELASLGVPLIGFAGGPSRWRATWWRGRRRAPAHQALMQTIRSCGPDCSIAWPIWPWPPCGHRSEPEPRRCSSSTAGPGPCPPPTTRVSCSRPCQGAGRRRGAGRPPHPLRRGDGRAARAHGRGRGRRRRHRLAGPPRPGPPPGGPGPRRAREPGPGVCVAGWEPTGPPGDVLRRGGGTGHVFNLGHGVHPETDPDVLRRLVDLVHAADPAELAASTAGPMSPVGVLVMAHGTPASLDGVADFYTEIRRGQPPSAEQLGELARPLRGHRRDLPPRRAHPGAGGRHRVRLATATR